jgi:hypothetical protein
MKGESESGLRILGCDEWEQFGDGLIERFSASRLGCAQQLLEFGHALSKGFRSGE